MKLQRSNPHWQRLLLSKQGQVIVGLARLLLDYEVDQRLPAIQELTEALAASAGTVQSALALLQQQGAAQLESRGRLGTLVQALDYPQLWALATSRAMIGAMPLPYMRQIEGLATGIRAAFGGQPVNLEMRFARGANARLQMLQTFQCDWVVVSQYRVESATMHGFEIDVVVSFGPDSYTSRQVLLLGPGLTQLTDGMRIGIDSHSADHAYAVRSAVRGRRITFVEMDYSQGVDLIRSGVIDATVWSSGDSSLSKALTVLPLETCEDAAFAHLREAVLVTRPGEPGILHVLRSLINVNDVLERQRQVVAYHQLPTY